MSNSNSKNNIGITNSNQNKSNNCENDGFEKTKVYPLTFNKDYALPFFAYGLFKPGQLAYSRIEKYVDIVKTDKTPRRIPYKMITRDGVPLIEDKENNEYYTMGYLIYFKKGSEKQAYNTISKTRGMHYMIGKKLKLMMVINLMF